jgi:DNA repair exonuclease SbcCD ATPase subunit
MPEQAILDLPVIEFELYQDSMGRLHAQCIESYGLAGFRPHPDAVFHFTASLWRYREEETLKQVAGLSTFYLRALSRHVAARRRVAAVRTAMEEQGVPATRTRLAEADEDLAYAQEDLSDISSQVADFVTTFLQLQGRAPAAARERLTENLAAMGEPGWSDRLETLAKGFGQIENTRIDWSAPLHEVLDDIEALNLPEPTNGNGNGHGEFDGGVLQRLNAELEQYRSLATRASSRLQEVDNERHQLESLLQDRDHGSTDHSAALEEARHALETTLKQARERLESMERSHGAALQDARHEIAQLKAERDRLAAELVHTLDTSTDTESSQEELIEKLESASGDRVEAAQALSALARRLEEVQNDADASAAQTETLNTYVTDLEATLDELRDEVSRAEQRHQQAEATIRALESGAGRGGEFDAILTESEERLADAQERQADAELKVDQLAGQLEDKQYELVRLTERVEGQKKTIDSISVQLAESETLADEHEARIAALERENERLRRDLSDSQSKMLDARGDVDEARDSAEVAKNELQRLKDRLEEERGKATSMSGETLELRANLRDRDEEVVALRTELHSTQQRLKKTERISDEQARKSRDLHDEIEKQREIAAAATSEIERVRAELKTARDEAANRRSEAEGLGREREGANAEIEKVRAELETLRSSTQSGGSNAAIQRARAVELEQQVAALRIEQQADRDLAADRRKKLEERLALSTTRAANAEAEAKALLDTLEQTERARQSERREAEALLESRAGHGRADEGALQEALAEAAALRQKLNESEAFLIKRQREFERTETQLKGLMAEIGSIADLRGKYEKSKSDKKREEFASQIGRRIDSLFAAAGKPVRADRKTEKIVILTVKKTDQEMAEQAEKPFIATNRDEDSSSDEPSES